MSKIEIVRAAMVTAMKNKDKARKDSLSMLLSALKKEIKQAKETMDTAPESRQDIREEARARMEVYKEFAPEDMSADQIKEVIAAVLAELAIEAPTPADKGKIMKVLMPKVKGKADGKMVNEILAGMFK